jgi:hypothetical protein
MFIIDDGDMEYASEDDFEVDAEAWWLYWQVCCVMRVIGYKKIFECSCLWRGCRAAKREYLSY